VSTMLVKMHCKKDVDVLGGPKCNSNVGFLDVVASAAVEFVVLGNAANGEDDGDAFDRSSLVEPLGFVESAESIFAT
jgi:hypothetical protein